MRTIYYICQNLTIFCLSLSLLGSLCFPRSRFPTLSLGFSAIICPGGLRFFSAHERCYFFLIPLFPPLSLSSFFMVALSLSLSLFISRIHLPRSRNAKAWGRFCKCGNGNHRLCSGSRCWRNGSLGFCTRSPSPSARSRRYSPRWFQVTVLCAVLQVIGSDVIFSTNGPPFIFSTIW